MATNNREFDSKLEKRKQEIQKDLEKRTNARFYNSNKDIVEEEFKINTVGLLSREEYIKKAENINQIIQDKQNLEQQQQDSENLKETLKRKREYKKKTQFLSFADDEEIPQMEQSQQNNKEQGNNDNLKQIIIQNKDNGEEVIQKKVKLNPLGKNPAADTSFLPDQQREIEEQELRTKLKEEYLINKQKICNQIINLKFSYWDGFKVKKDIQIPKNTTILEFLRLAKNILLPEYPVLKRFQADQLLFIIKNHIVSHKWSFYDIETRNLKTNKGENLFNFEQIDEINFIDKTNIVMIIDKVTSEKSGPHLFPFVKNII